MYAAQPRAGVGPARFNLEGTEDSRVPTKSTREDQRPNAATALGSTISSLPKFTRTVSAT
jgi:hypothetical protein